MQKLFINNLFTYRERSKPTKDYFVPNNYRTVLPKVGDRHVIEQLVEKFYTNGTIFTTSCILTKFELQSNGCCREVILKHKTKVNFKKSS